MPEIECNLTVVQILRPVSSAGQCMQLIFSMLDEKLMILLWTF